MSGSWICSLQKKRLKKTKIKSRPFEQICIWAPNYFSNFGLVKKTNFISNSTNKIPNQQKAFVDEPFTSNGGMVISDVESHFSEFPDLRIAHSSGYPG